MSRPGRPRISQNAKLNETAFRAMSICERECGMTAQQLSEIQRGLRTDFYSRRSS